MRSLYLLSVWVHILAAAVWIGGIVFFALILVPGSRRPEYRGAARSLVQWSAVRFRSVSWICLVLLFLTGMVTLAYRGIGWEQLWNGELWEGSFGQVLGIKLLGIALILVVKTLHDFVVGPRASLLGKENPSSPEALRLWLQASWLARLDLFLAILVVALAVIMVRGWTY